MEHRNASLSTARRVEALLQLMTREEKVAQLYVHRPAEGVTTPVKELLGFLRVPLGYLNQDLVYTVSPGEVSFFVGAPSSDIRLSISASLLGATSHPLRSSPV